MVSFPDSGSSCHPLALLEVLVGQCQDLGAFPDTGQYLDVLQCSRTHILVQTSLLAACALSEVQFDVVQLDQIELGGEF